jgi:hypothetical protein
MGILNRRHRKENAGEQDNASDPVTTAAAAIASTGDATLALGLVINRLLTEGAVSVESLAKIGLSREEVVGLVEAFEGADTAGEFEAALDLQAALRHYNSELALIAGERGLSTRGDEYVALRSAIADFAEKNDLLDVRIAYRLMLAECPERLPGRH